MPLSAFCAIATRFRGPITVRSVLFSCQLHPRPTHSHLCAGARLVSDTRAHPYSIKHITLTETGQLVAAFRPLAFALVLGCLCLACRGPPNAQQVSENTALCLLRPSPISHSASAYPVQSYLMTTKSDPKDTRLTRPLRLCIRGISNSFVHNHQAVDAA